MANPYLQALDPLTITTTDTSFTRMARQYREPGEQGRWIASGMLDGAGSGAGLGKGEEESEREEVAEGRLKFGRDPIR